ncbi:MAG: transposase [Verrucomicrobiae bacterium]|nr:transposase [Verrucomicrobiae bacterium]
MLPTVDELLQFFHEYEEIEKHGFKLPHWQQPGACYFLTFRLADSIPRQLLDKWEDDREAWLKQHPPPWTPELEQEYHERFSRQIEHWLDQAHGECVFREPEIAEILAQVLLFHDGAEGRYQIHSFVIMPNHVHGLFSLHPDYRLEDCLKNWKGISARHINQLLGREGNTLWQRNYFDRLIRNAHHFTAVARYIRRNPAKANLSPGSYHLYESDLVKNLLDA